MKCCWEEKKLGEIIKLEYGKPLSDDKRTPDGKYPVYGANGEKDRTNEFYYDKPSIIVGRKGSAGEVNLTEKRFWPLDVTYFVTFDEKQYCLKFLFNLLLTLDLPSLAKGVKPGINRNEVYGIAVKTPPLPEQERVVGFIDGVFEKATKAKENAEKNLQNARELFESYLQGTFTLSGKSWEQKSLEELGVITSSKRIFKSEYVKDGVPFYRTKEIKELANGKDISLELFISRERYNEIKNKFGIPKEGDVLLSAVGTIGEIYVVQKDDEFYFKDGNIVWLKDFNSVDKYYLKYALQSFVEQIRMLSRGAAYSALTIEKLNKYKIPVPSIKEQQQIIVKLDSLSAEIKKLQHIYQQKLADLEELKKSVLHKAFNGELAGACS